MNTRTNLTLFSLLFQTKQIHHQISLYPVQNKYSKQTRTPVETNRTKKCHERTKQ